MSRHVLVALAQCLPLVAHAQRSPPPLPGTGAAVVTPGASVTRTTGDQPAATVAQTSSAAGTDAQTSPASTDAAAPTTASTGMSSPLQPAAAPPHGDEAPDAGRTPEPAAAAMTAPDAGAPVPAPSVWDQVLEALHPYATIKPTIIVSSAAVESFSQPNASAITAAGNPALALEPDHARLTFQVAQTRLGLQLNEKGVVRGQVEIDFAKASPTTASLPRLRIAKVEIVNKKIVYTAAAQVDRPGRRRHRARRREVGAGVGDRGRADARRPAGRRRLRARR